MAKTATSIIATRGYQMFPVLEPADLERRRRFGEARSYGAGETLAKAGKLSPGLIVRLAGTEGDADSAPHPNQTFPFFSSLRRISRR